MRNDNAISILCCLNIKDDIFMSGTITPMNRYRFIYKVNNFKTRGFVYKKIG